MKEARCLSLRDPSGRLFELDGRLIRLVLRNTAPEVQAVLAWLHTIQPFVHGRVVGTQTIGEDAFRALLETAPDQLEGLIDEQDPFVLEHEKIQPRSYPFEWPAEMLHHAAELTLDLAEQALAAGLGLKDATPYNIIFDSTEPVFVDLLSFERRVPNDPTWLPYSQFVRSFVLPLLLNKHLNFPLSQSILTNRDGPLPEDAYRWCVSLRMRMKPGLLTSVTIPTWLGRTLGSDPKWLYAKHLTKNSTQASYILKSLFRRLRRVVRQATPVEAKMSLWSGYCQTTEIQHPDYVVEKAAFVRETLASLQPSNVLDVGCNTGTFSRIAADAGARVVAVDSDPAVVGQVWRRAHADQMRILPLVVDLARPTPGMGWMNRETLSFLDRMSGQFDLVLMLALIHHLLVTEGIPVREILRLASMLTRQAVVIEYVDPADPMFQQLTRGRGRLHSGFGRQMFEQECLRVFHIRKAVPTKGSLRWFYLLEHRP